MFKKEEVATNIATGEFDDILNHLELSISVRREQLASQFSRSLKVGDVVEFTSDIRPKYLIGKTATVEKINRKTVTVSCPDDPSYKRYRNSRGVRCPNTLIQKVEA
jgi:hypothetical protein